MNDCEACAEVEPRLNIRLGGTSNKVSLSPLFSGNRANGFASVGKSLPIFRQMVIALIFGSFYQEKEHIPFKPLAFNSIGSKRLAADG